MILSDSLPRQNLDNSNPHEIIPILFKMHNLVHEKNIIIQGKQKNI